MSLRFAPGKDLASVGHHFFIGLKPTPDLCDEDKRLLSTLKPAGIILFKKNFQHGADYDTWRARYAKLLAEARQCVERDEIFVAIDHEGGSIVRPPAPITVFPQAADWGGEVEAVGAAMGEELASLGVNVSFAPVLDIDSNPKNPVIGRRAFGATPSAVIDAARRFRSGLERQGVIACGKHYPGHGDTETDSHFALPVLDADEAAISSRELLPFKALARDGVRMIMTAHILFPRIEDEVPATMSGRLIDGLLRQEFGFDGVVTTDDIGMQAVSKLFEDPAATERTLNAGCDLVMVCSHWSDNDRALALAKAVLDGLRRGAIREATLEASFRRIAALLAAVPKNAVVPLPPDRFAAHQALAARLAAGKTAYPASVV